MPSRPKNHILVVDDNEMNRYMLVKTLTRAGYQVNEAATGEGALNAIANAPDLLILDVKLPDMNGLELSRVFRQNPRTQHIPILQISATFTQRSDKIKGLDAGADAYLPGPVDSDELLAHVRMLLRLKDTQDELARTNEQLRAIAEEMQLRMHDLQVTQKELGEARDELKRQNELLEQRVRERTAKLGETISDLETFSYSITHDMRAPLRAMQGFSRLLLESHSQQLDPQGMEFLHRIANSANRLDLLIRDVLTYSNIVRAQVKLEPVDLDRLVREIISDYPGFQPPSADIVIPHPLPRVLGNEAFLTQCFSNLLANAVKFVEKGRTPRVEITSEWKDDAVRVTIRDNGIGIAREHQPRLFTLFHRAQNQYPGTGIGLAVVRKAVNRIGGQVGLESAPGSGSAFWLELRPVS